MVFIPSVFCILPNRPSRQGVRPNQHVTGPGSHAPYHPSGALSLVHDLTSYRRGRSGTGRTPARRSRAGLRTCECECECECASTCVSEGRPSSRVLALAVVVLIRTPGPPRSKGDVGDSVFLRPLKTRSEPEAVSGGQHRCALRAGGARRWPTAVKRIHAAAQPQAALSFLLPAPSFSTDSFLSPFLTPSPIPPRPLYVHSSPTGICTALISQS